MTELQDNPNSDTETYSKPRRWVLESRPSMALAFVAQSDVLESHLDRMRELVDRYNSQFGYRKYRIVSR